jgi:hypothetical protein
MYLLRSTNNGSSTAKAPDVGKLSGSDFHPLNSVIPTPAVELEDSLLLLELLLTDEDEDEEDDELRSAAAARR